MRTLARTETFMPMKPAAADSTAPMKNPIAVCTPSTRSSMTRITTPDQADRHILPVQVGARAFLHGRRDFLHAGRSGIRGKHLPGW